MYIAMIVTYKLLQKIPLQMGIGMADVFYNGMGQ